MTNIKSAQQLLEQYKALTLEQLKQAYDPSKHVACHQVLGSITGFGDYKTCQLCAEARQLTGSKNPKIFCNVCIYNDGHFDQLYCVDDTYEAMVDAETLEELFVAIQNRIIYLEQTIKDYEC